MLSCQMDRGRVFFRLGRGVLTHTPVLFSQQRVSEWDLMKSMSSCPHAHGPDEEKLQHTRTHARV